MLLLLPAAAAAEDDDADVRAVVRISGFRHHKPELGSAVSQSVQGSGFVVRLDGDSALIVTAAHVIENVQDLDVVFAADPPHHYSTVSVLRADFANPRGLAVLNVGGKIPLEVTILNFEAEAQSQIQRGEELSVIGFRDVAPRPLTLVANFAGADGNFLQLGRSVAEGFSGSPVLRRGKVLAVVVGEDTLLTFALKAVVARDAVVGWGVKLGVQGEVSVTSSVAPTRPPLGPACTPGEELTENDITYVRICPGSFTMGSTANDQLADSGEKPAHQVTLREFWLGKTEITKEQARHLLSGHHGDGPLPATDVSWFEARGVCERLGGRLPTEAEWEYAARAGSTVAWSFGDDEKRLGEYAWYDKNSSVNVHPVGTKKPNAWGLYDMHGNVWEWVADWYGVYPSVAQTDPAGPATGTHRVVRGGAYTVSPWDLRSAERFWVLPTFSGQNFGFRCVRGLRRQP